MKRAFALALLLLTARAAAAQSELRFTLHIQMHPLAGGTDQGVPVPANETDSLSIVGNGAVRTESSPGAGFPRGLITITRPDSIVLLDPEQKTVFRQAIPSPMPDAPGGHASFTRTGEFETIVGVRAERVLFAISFDLPANDVAPARTISTTGEMWLTDRFADYNAGTGQGMPGNLFANVGERPSGFTMKAIIRGGILGPNEVQTAVTSIVEEPLRPELFVPPPDFRERTVNQR